MNENLFIKEVEKLGYKLTEIQLKQFAKYIEFLLKENKEYNLTRITDINEIYLKHFYDSITLGKYLEDKETLCDIGSGAGFPGVVLKVLFPKLKIYLLESVSKKAEFLTKLIKELNLNDIYVINKRAEEYQEEKREYFDIVTARAVARLNILMELSSPLLKPKGIFISQKGNNGEIEFEEAKKAAKELKLESWEINEFKLPIEHSVRFIFAYHKAGKLNSKYPRKYSQIKKKPL